MMTAEQTAQARQAALRQLSAAGIVLTPREQEEIEIADFGLGQFARTGLALVVYANNDRYCAKELVLLPGQLCPEHRHPAAADNPRNPGKQETFRVRRGEVWLYVPGPETPGVRERVRAEDAGVFSVFYAVRLRPGEQYTLTPDTRHWFQAGADGAVVSEFSSTSDDASDVFTDPRIRRLP